jgi:hypothetical protein
MAAKKEEEDGLVKKFLRGMLGTGKAGEAADKTNAYEERLRQTTLTDQEQAMEERKKREKENGGYGKYH